MNGSLLLEKVGLIDARFVEEADQPLPERRPVLSPVVVEKPRKHWWKKRVIRRL